LKGNSKYGPPHCEKKNQSWGVRQEGHGPGGTDDFQKETPSPSQKDKTSSRKLRQSTNHKSSNERPNNFYGLVTKKWARTKKSPTVVGGGFGVGVGGGQKDQKSLKRGETYFFPETDVKENQKKP